MKTRMKATSLLANSMTDKPTGCAKVLRCIYDHPGVSYIDIAGYCKMKVPTVCGRINDLLYVHQLIRPITTVNNLTLYRVRAESDPLNVRPKSEAEILKDKLDAVMYEFNITEQQVSEAYRKLIELRLQKGVSDEQEN